MCMALNEYNKYGVNIQKLQKGAEPVIRKTIITTGIMALRLEEALNECNQNKKIMIQVKKMKRRN